MPFPTLFDPPGGAVREEPPYTGPLLGEGMSAEERPVAPGRERRLAAAAAASGTIHALAIVLVIVLLTDVAKPPDPDRPVEMMFVRPAAPLVQPRLEPARPRAAAPAVPPGARRPVPEPPQPSPSFTPQTPQLTPPVPLPKPNRMGEQVPVPPPPKVTRETPPPDESEVLPDAQRGEKPPAPAQAGVPEGQGKALPEGAPGSGVSPQTGGGAPRGETAGQLPVPGRVGPPGPPRPGPGGEGSRFPGSGARPPRRGINLGVPFDTGVYQNFTFEHQDYDWTDYWPQMYHAILRAWYNRLLATASLFERAAYERGDEGLRGQTMLQFTIERNGNISRAVIVTPSGIIPLDDSARDALREVILPPLPDNFPHERENVTGLFRMDVPDIRSMGPNLQAMKSQRYF